MEYFHEYAKPFFFEGNDEGCLLIHGFSGSPAHMRLLGEFLHAKGYTVSGILLKGHGTRWEDMEKTDWRDWLESAKEGYMELGKRCRKVYAMGLSMGGILSLILAQNYPVDKLVSIASPIRIFDKLAWLTPILKYFKRYNAWGESKPGEGEDTRYDKGYPGIPVSSVPSLLKLMKMAERNLSKVRCPALIIQSRTDETVKPKSARMIYEGIGSEQKEILWLECSRHVCTLGPERDIMHEKIYDFLKQ